MQEEALENIMMEDVGLQEDTASSLTWPPPRAESRAPLRKPRVYTKEEWETQKPNIEQFYRVEDKSLPELVQILGQEFGFFATQRQYKRRIKDWGLEKNLKKRDMSAIIRKQQRRTAEGKKSMFVFKGRQVEPSKIERAQKRCGEFSNIFGSQHSPSTSTPSDLACYTPDSGAPLEALKAESSVLEVNQQIQAGIHWPPSPSPVRNTLYQLSPHSQTTTQSTQGTPRTPFLMSILNSVTDDFTGQSPAPVSSTPAPASSPLFDADVSNSSIGFIDTALDSILTTEHYFNFTEWSFNDIHTDFMPLGTGSDHIRDMFDDHQNLNSEMAPPVRRRYKEEEEEKYRQQLLRLETISGSEHPTTIESRLNLAEVLCVQGRHGAAELLCQQAAATSQKALGGNHEMTFQAFELLLRNFIWQGKYLFADTNYRSLRRRALIVLGREHSITVVISFYMACNLMLMKKFNEAMLLQQEIFEFISGKIGFDHPLTFRCMNDLACSLTALGQLEEAERLLQEALRLQKQNSPNEPLLSSSKGYLAMLYYTQGRYEESENLVREVLSVRSSLFGSEHPDTLQALNLLALILSGTKRQEQSRKMKLYVLGKRTKVLGLNHPDTKDIQRALDEENIDW